MISTAGEHDNGTDRHVRTGKTLVMLMTCTLLLCFLVAPVLSVSGSGLNPGITVKPGVHQT